MEQRDFFIIDQRCQHIVRPSTLQSQWHRGARFWHCSALLRHRGATFWAPRRPRSGAEAPRCPFWAPRHLR
ncbi:hypothetical protein TorRG33x02_267340 [Trema orientale]|uniref:Uncharacterized protein n=1 Tax=Trema orientale TaxID=63057 RepID=A0A2P5D046_TREOI|nr:hypothetical protein TorRG33x02_267340 [Trema orientale]